jgi:hypothetical protein
MDKEIKSEGEPKIECVYHTELVRVRNVISTGYLGVMRVRDYKDVYKNVQLHNITDEQLSECKSKWVFMLMEDKQGKLSYVKHVVCSDLMYHTMHTHHCKSKSKKTSQ